MRSAGLAVEKLATILCISHASAEGLARLMHETVTPHLINRNSLPENFVSLSKDINNGRICRKIHKSLY
jgi:hypothetical protein